MFLISGRLNNNILHYTVMQLRVPQRNMSCAFHLTTVYLINAALNYEYNYLGLNRIRSTSEAAKLGETVGKQSGPQQVDASCNG